MTTRILCFNALEKVRRGGYSNIILDTMLEENELDQRDKSFCSALFYGTLEKQQLLDYLIKTRLQKGRKPDGSIWTILEMGMYQLLFMDGVDDFAAVNETVKLAHSTAHSTSAGFINAVLRGFIRDGKKIVLPDRGVNAADYLSIKYSCPKHIVELWIKSYGELTAESILKTLEGRAPIFIRVNTKLTNSTELIKRLETEGVKSKSVTGFPNTLIIENTGAIDGHKSYTDGLFHVQDLSSQFCCEIIDPLDNEVILDCCAAPGGKSFTLSEISGQGTKIISCDIHQSRVRLIHNGCKRLRLSNIIPYERDALKGKRFAADKVLCDVPCSGLGIIRRKMDIKNKDKSEIEKLPELQYSILKASSTSVKPNGLLFYTTCTLNPMENQEVAKRFLRENPDFEEYSFRKRAGEQPYFKWQSDSMLTIFPRTDGGDGFFISCFKSKGRSLA